MASGIGTPWIYTAAATIPMSGNPVTVILFSEADTTKTATTEITL